MTITFETVILAKDEESARDVFLLEQHDIIEQGLDAMNSPSFEVIPLKQEHKLPENWGQSCIPFGETEDRTIEQIWESEDEAD